jgi:hypothetical protein
MASVAMSCPCRPGQRADVGKHSRRRPSQGHDKLRQANVALGVEMLAQAYRGDCGQGVERYASAPGTASIAAKIQRAGIELSFAAIDESFWFGHYYQGPHACRSTVLDVARRVAANIAERRKVFPRIAIGDIEPIPALTMRSGWQSDYREWMERFRTTTGYPLGFLHVDVDWDAKNWQTAAVAASRFVYEAGLPFGTIYDASPHMTLVHATRAGSSRLTSVYEPCARPRDTRVMGSVFNPRNQ